jgi:hypothetical protein
MVAETNCGVCQEDASRLFEREAVLSPQTSVRVRCCPRCVRKVDAENQEHDWETALKGMGKAERKAALQEQSFQWACGWHGKKVVVTFDIGDGYGGVAKGGCQVKGQAFRATDVSGGWGNVCVVLDGSEKSRVSYIPKGGLAYRKGHQVWVDLAILDGFRYGPALAPFVEGRDTGHSTTALQFFVSWGQRGEYVIEEDEDAENVETRVTGAEALEETEAHSAAATAAGIGSGGREAQPETQF